MRYKKVRIKDIARRLGISPATVSQALNHPEQVNRSTRREVLTLCENLGYSRPVKSKRRKFNLAVVSGDAHNFTNDFYAGICEQLLLQIKKYNYNLIFEPWGDAEDDFPISISRGKVDGVISLGGFGHDKIILIKQKNLPIVLCGHPLSNLEIHTIMPDGRAGIYQICKYLIELGHKKIAMITGGKEFDQVSRDRLDGYKHALSESEIAIKEEFVLPSDFIYYEKTEKAIDKILTLKDRPTAVVCASDPIAYCAYETLKKRGYSVPGDFSLTGFDNLQPPKYSAGFLPKLTTVNVDVKEMAKYSLEVIFQLIKDPKRVAWRYTLPVKLEIGETTLKKTSLK